MRDHHYLTRHPVVFVIAQFVSSEALSTILAIALIAIAVTLPAKKSLRAMD